QQQGHDLAGCELRLDHIFWTANIEVIIFCRIQVMTLAKQAHDLARGLRHRLARYCRAEDVIQPELSRNPLLCGGVRHHHEVVLILAGRGKAFALKHPENPARDILEKDVFANRIFGSEKIVDYGMAQYAYGRRKFYVTGSEEGAALDCPAPYLQELGCNAAIKSCPVLSGVHNLDVTVNVRGNTFDQRDLFADRLCIGRD